MRIIRNKFQVIDTYPSLHKKFLAIVGQVGNNALDDNDSHLIGEVEMREPESNKGAANNDETATFLSVPMNGTAKRIKSKDLLQQSREVEIDHEGRIYRLRLTQLNKLILTA